MNLSPLGFLLDQALLPGRTGFDESGVRCSLKPREGETFLFFRLDETRRGKGPNGKTSVAFEKHFGIGERDLCADLLLLCIRKRDDSVNDLRLVVVELKGSDHEHAIAQIDRTLHAMKESLSGLLGSDLFKQPSLRALIVSNRKGSPKHTKHKDLGFFKKWGTAPITCHSDAENEFRKHLWDG